MTDIRDFLEKAQWLIDRGYAFGDVFKIAEKLSSINKQEEGAPTPPTLNTETTGDSADV